MSRFQVGDRVRFKYQEGDKFSTIKSPTMIKTSNATVVHCVVIDNQHESYIKELYDAFQILSNHSIEQLQQFFLEAWKVITKTANDSYIYCVQPDPDFDRHDLLITRSCWMIKDYANDRNIMSAVAPLIWHKLPMCSEFNVGQ